MSTQFANQLAEQVPQWSNYVTLPDDVKPYLQYPVGDVSRDSTMQALVDAACYWVQDYLGQPVAPTLFFRRFDGWSGYSGAYITLPYAPILQYPALPVIVEWWGSNGPQNIVLQTPESQQAGSQCYQLSALQGRITRTFAGLVARPWFPGLQNVEVEWWAGYNPIPPTIRFATLELIKYWWTNTQQASRTGPRGSSDYGGSIEPNAGLYPGVPNRVTEMLQSFTHYAIG
jgi:hypothetical protein